MTQPNPLKRVTDRLERLKQRTYKNATPSVYGGKYQWVFGWTKKERKTVVLGPFGSTIEAERILATLEDGEVFEYDTIDVTRATREIKAELIARGGDPDETLRRVLHQKGYDREVKRITNKKEAK